MLGRTLPLSIIEHCFAKYLLKIFDLVRKFVSKISFTRRGGIVGIFSFQENDLKLTNMLLGLSLDYLVCWQDLNNMTTSKLKLDHHKQRKTRLIQSYLQASCYLKYIFM